MNLKIYKLCRIIIIFLVFGISVPSVAQVVKQQDYSNIHIDELTDEQIRAFVAQFEAKGLSEAQLDKEAQAGGMSSVELQKLHARVEKLKNSTPGPGDQTSGRQVNGPQDTVRSRVDVETESERALAELKSKIFGADFFRDGANLIPNFNMATPVNYQIGPGDQIIINVYGNSLADWKLTVTPEGTINIPGAGILNLSGKTIEQATALIRSRLIANNYAIGRGTSLQVSLGNIRTIQVIVNGEAVKPGTYPLPSFATAFNALYAAGGPSENGSFRQIEIIRAGNKIATLDIYDFLLHGDLKNNVQLRDQDIIHIPTYKIRVEVSGEVKHPAIFEMLPGEKLANLMQFAGDFTEQAYKSRIRVIKNTDKERSIADVTPDEFADYSPSTGDKYYVDKILDRYVNRVSIQGAVFRPGPYELTPGLTVGQLIRKAEGLREDAFMNRGQILRLKEDLQSQSVPFNVAQVLAGGADIPLKREDIVVISSVSDLKEEFTFTIQGEVQHPGTFKFAEGTSLEDAIIRAGGLKESATSQRIEIARRVKNSNALSVSAVTAEVITMPVDPELRANATAFILQPFDIVTVRPSSGYEIQKAVQVTGEVLYPGSYTITKKNERISDIIKRAGGFTAFAYPEGASLKRQGPPADSVEIQKKLEEARLKQLRLQKAAGDSSQVDMPEELLIRNNYVGIDLPAILNNPGGREDIFLEEGDVIMIPKQLQTVKISGQVLSPNTVVYIKNKNFKHYISSAGGFSDRSKKRRSYILYANGSVRSTHRILFFSDYPVVKPGAEIFVPQKPEKRKLTPTELIGISTGLASLAAIVISLLR